MKKEQIISWCLYPWTFQVLANPSQNLMLVIHCSVGSWHLPTAHLPCTHPTHAHPPVLPTQLDRAGHMAEFTGAARTLCWRVCWKGAGLACSPLRNRLGHREGCGPIKPVNWLWFEPLILSGYLVTWLGGQHRRRTFWIESAGHLPSPWPLSLFALPSFHLHLHVLSPSVPLFWPLVC